MANIVSSDTIEGTLIVGSGGMRHPRSFIVENLSGPGSNRHKQALDTVGIVRGDAHPHITLLPAASAIVEMMGDDNTIAKVTWTYAVEGESSVPPTGDATQIEVGATVQSVQSHRDVNGKVISVSYTPPATTENPEPSQDTQGGTVEIQVPLVTLNFTRRETPTWGGTTIGDRAALFVGRTNSVNWQSFGTDRWLCIALVGNSTDGGATYTTRYSFILNERIWRARVVYVDSSGRVPTDLVNDVGDKLVRIYHRIDFHTLRLT